MTVADIPQGYQEVPEEDRRKAKVFFDRGKTVAGTGQYDYAIEMFLQGLTIDPDAVEAHQDLREISLRRKASGGKNLGMFERMKIKSGKDDKQNMLTAEKLLAYDPGNTDQMMTMTDSAYKAGFYDTVMWIGPLTFKANGDSGKPDFNKYQKLKDIYRALGQWKLATDACQAAVELRPDDMDLIKELKDLGAEHTMSIGKYAGGGSFRDSIKDMDGQRKLLEADMDVRTEDMMSRMIRESEAEWKAQPDEAGKIGKYVDALVKSEVPANENKAVEILTNAFEKTKQFRFRQAAGRIKIKQMDREERLRREKMQKNPQDEAVREEYRKFFLDKTEEELKEFTLWAEAYPTDLIHKYEVAKRMFALQRFSEAIPVFQTARQDPKIRVEASIFLARSFLEASFIDESVDTLHALIEDYQIKGDAKSKEMYYWYARALEGRNEVQPAIKAYSQVAQWDFNYRDVQARIKRLRGLSGPGAGPAAT